MVYIALFNTEYNRQFEVIISRKRWNGLVKEYGTVDAAIVALITSSQIQLRDVRKAAAFRQFLRYTRETGEFFISIKTKRTTPLGKGEYLIGNRADRRTKKDLRRMNLEKGSLDLAVRRSSLSWKTIKELEEKYDKDYSLKAVKEREGRTRW